MKRLFAATSAVALLAALPVMAQNTMGGASSAQTGKTIDQQDRQFINEAASGGMAEVKLGQLAQQKAAEDSVKSFGNRMVTDHQKANNDLKQVADKVGVTLPTKLESKDQTTYDRLSKLNGPEFDRAYMQDMVADHRKDVADFQKESSAAQNPDLKDFVTKTTPVLQQHLAMAQQVQNSIIESGSSSKAKTGSKSSHATSKHSERRSMTKRSDNSMTAQLNREEAERLQRGSR